MGNIDKKRVVIFGAGDRCPEAMSIVGLEKVRCIIDNNPQKWGNTIEGIEVLSIDDIPDLAEYLIVISCCKHWFEVIDQLDAKGTFSYISMEKFNIDLYNIFASFNPDGRILLFGTPTHSNIGDHAIAEAEKSLLKKKYPGKVIVEISEREYMINRMEIGDYIKNDRKLYITGGGFLGTLWMEWGEYLVRSIMQLYGNRELVILPQSVYFSDDDIGKKEMNESARIYKGVTRLTLMVREKNSYNRACKLFDKRIVIKEVPDVVLSMDTDIRNEMDSKKAGVCLKDNHESVLSNQIKKDIYDTLSRDMKETELFSMKGSKESILPRDRDEEIKRKMKEIAQYRIVVTDCLHCMVFCALTKTPCIAIDNISGKVSGVYEFISGMNFIEIWNRTESIEPIIKKVLNAKRGGRINADESIWLSNV